MGRGFMRSREGNSAKKNWKAMKRPSRLAGT